MSTSVFRSPITSGLASDVRFALRMLLGYRLHAAVAVLTLAVAVGAATAVFTVLNAVVIQPLPYPVSDRLVVIRDSSPPRFPTFSVAPGRFLEWQRRSRVFDGIAATTSGAANLTGEGDPERLTVAYASANLFDVLGVPPMLGRAFTAQEDRDPGPRAVVLSYALWQNRFAGRADIVGHRISLDEQPTTVVGVMPPGFDFPARTVRAWLPLALGDAARRNYGSHYLRLVGRVQAGVSIEAAREDLSRAARELGEAAPENRTWTTLVDDLHGFTIRDVRAGLWLLVAAAGGVLLIACANVAGLLVARGADREREFAVRSALGASRLRLARQLLVESAALGVAGAALGILLGATILRTLVATSWFALPRTTDLSFDGAALAFAIAMAIVTPIVFGLIPSLQTARPRHGSALTSGGRTGGSAMRSRTRSTLIVVEVALAVMLVAGSTLLLRSLDRLLRIEPGFAPAGLLTVGVSLPTERYGSDLLRANFFGSLVEQVGVIPGVEHAAAAMPVPFVSDMVASLDIDDREADPETRPTSNFYAVTPGYFEAMGIRLLRGRDIALGDNRPDAARVAVVSKRLAETVLGGLDVLGRRVRISQGPRREFATVIGVAADVRQYSLDGALTSQIYEPAAQHPYFGTTHIVVRAGVPAETLVPSLRQAVASLDPLLPLGQVVLLEERIADSTGPRRSTTALLAGLAAVALLLSAVGVYGLVSFSVGRRIQEFGLRIALGAEPGAIMRLVLGEGLWLAGLGVAIGLVGALMAGRLVEAQLFQVSARDPIALAGAAFVLVSATLAACYGPARRALGVNPVSALRQS